MSRDKKFVIDSIKMDLYRVVTATGDISKDIPYDSVKTFLEHADKDFDKIELVKHEKDLRIKLKQLTKRIHELQTDKDRLRWTEDVLTVRSML